jgi:hypothetical protein
MPGSADSRRGLCVCVCFLGALACVGSQKTVNAEALPKPTVISVVVQEPECANILPRERSSHGCRCPWGGRCACDYTLYPPKAGFCQLVGKMELEGYWFASQSSDDGGVTEGGIYDRCLGQGCNSEKSIPLGAGEVLCGRTVTCQ